MSLNFNVVGLLASHVGVPEPALKLLFSILYGYPIAYIYQKYINGKKPLLQHLYFITTGLYLGYYNFGTDIFHCIANVFFTYCVLLVIGPNQISVAVVFIVTMIHLFYGYLSTATDQYDITYTMPLCVLVLRLIGLAFNYFDGTQDQNKLSKDFKEVAIKKLPSLLEVFGFCFFPSSFLIGPQFPLIRYQNLVSGKYRKIEKEEAWSFSSYTMKYALKRAAIGFFYMTIYQIGNAFVSDTFMISDELVAYPFWKRCFILGIYGRLVFYKYISCWLLGEGACILFGLGYDGKDAEGNLKLDKMANINLKVFEGATTHINYVDSFNVQTNKWVLMYIYKRLKFMGNKYISQAAVLVFLSVWHGFHSGYYTTFFMEFIIVAFEKDLTDILKRNETFLNITSKDPYKTITYLVLKLYTFVCIGYCNGPFALLSFHKWWKLYKTFYFLGHILFMFWPIYRIVFIKYIFPPKKKSTKSS